MSKASNPPKPLTQHPMFPVVVAIWFAALFGLGSLAIRPGVLESTVLAMHIDAVVPAAAPPLGVTARILLALVLAALGCVLGLIAGNRLAARSDAPRRPRQRKGAAGELVATDDDAGLDARIHPDAPVRRPLFAHQDLGAPGIDADVAGPADEARPGRRRALSVTDETQPSQFLDRAPLPGGIDIQPLQAADQPTSEQAGDRVLDLDAAMAEPAPVAMFTPPPPAEVPELNWSQAAPVQAERPFDAPPPALQFALKPFPVDPGFEDEYEDEPVAELPLAPRQLFAPAAETAPEPAIAEPEPAEPDAVIAEPLPVATAAPAPVLAEPPSAAVPDVEQSGADQSCDAPAAPAPPVRTAAQNLASADLGDLGMVELAERLARAMQTRRERGAAPVPVAYEPPVLAEAAAPEGPSVEGEIAFEPIAFEPIAFEPLRFGADAGAAAPEPVAAAAEPAAPVADVPAMPAVFQPFVLDGGDDADQDIELPSLLARPSVAPVSEDAPEAPDHDAQAAAGQADGAEDEAEDDSDTGASDACGSLLDLSRPAPQRQEFVRIENEPEPVAIEPVVIFPGQSAQPSAGPRPFDPPGTRQLDQTFAPASTTAPAATVDAEEAERALKAALASLQRISGAA